MTNDAFVIARLIRQRKTGGEFTHTLTHFGKCIEVFDIQQDFADHIGDGGHFRLLHAAGGDCGSAQADAAGLERGAGFKGDGILVHGNSGFVERSLTIFTG